MKALIAVLLCVWTTTALAQPVTVRGKIVDAKTKQPVAGAVITAGSEFAASDDDGAFSITLPAGNHVIEVTAAWLVPKKQPVTIKDGAVLVIEVDQADQPTGERIEIIDIAPTAPGETKVDAKTARMVPGGGDAGKIVQSMPAVARPPAGSNEIVVWGAAPRDTRVFVDGVPVPALYHVGGYRSAIGDAMVGDIKLTPAAFGPDRGRAIGGVIDISYADPAKLPELRLQADPLDASVATKHQYGRLVTGYALRYSWLDRAVDLVADPRTLAPNAPLPQWLDAQWVARAKLRDDLVISGWVIAASDALVQRLESDDPATETAQSIDQTMSRAQITIRRDRPDGFDSATVWAGGDTDDSDLDVGPINASLHARKWLGGARGIQQNRLNDYATLTTGIDLDAEYARYIRQGSLSIPAREGDIHIFGQPPGDDVNADRWHASTVDLAGYGAIDLRAGPVTATLGARGDGWMLGTSRLTPRIGATPGIGSQEVEFTADPRASVAVRINEEFLVRADAGRYRQARSGSDASAVFGTPNLGLEKALHATLGAQWKRAPIALEVVGYGRKLDDLVARDPAVTPLFARALTQDGTGDVLGIQVTGRVIGYRGLTGWLSYSLSKSTRRDSPITTERLFDHDQTHGLIAVAGWEHGPYTLGGRVRVATGEPRTAVLGAFFDSRSGRFQPIRGEHNGVRLPVFFAADARGERTFTRGATKGAIYLELQNLTNRANAEEIIYSADFSQQGFLTSLPLLAIAGVRIEL